MRAVLKVFAGQYECDVKSLYSVTRAPRRTSPRAILGPPSDASMTGAASGSTIRWKLPVFSARHRPWFARASAMTQSSWYPAGAL